MTSKEKREADYLAREAKANLPRASNVLYRNRVDSVRHALYLVQLQSMQERIENPQVYPPDQGGAIEAEINAGLERLAYAARMCVSDLLDADNPTERLIHCWLHSPLVEVQQIGRCAFHKKWGALAC